MPEDGYYRRVKISREKASEILNTATEIVSSVGYPEVCQILHEISGVVVPLDIEKRVTTFTEDECTILVCKLVFREKAERKGVNRHTDINEYEFCLVHYKKNNPFIK
jgi:hypothetical protein